MSIFFVLVFVVPIPFLFLPVADVLSPSVTHAGVALRPLIVSGALSPIPVVVLSLFVSLPEELRLRNEVRHPASWLSLSSGTSAAAEGRHYRASVSRPAHVR